jgi:membrane associated rhomboid family serine protease
MVFFLYDEDPLERDFAPFVTYGLIAANILVFLLAPSGINAFTKAVALIPTVFVGETNLDNGFPSWLSLGTYMFIHASWFHLGADMLFLWVFGDNVEDAVGHSRFLAFYLLCGMASGIAYVLSDPSSTTPIVGASGAIAGIIAAYLMMRPCAKIVELIFFVFPIAVDARWAIGGWILLQVWHILVNTQNGITYWAHLGGLIAGALLILVMRQPGVRLFDCTRPPSLV